MVDTPSGSGGTILVVDDDPQVRALAARALADAGFDVLQAADAARAVELLEDPLGAHVCLVITDIVMTRMRGDELGRVLHESRPTLPVLYMSASHTPTSGPYSGRIAALLDGEAVQRRSPGGKGARALPAGAHCRLGPPIRRGVVPAPT
jgi:CheY-like chemotaxis protein